MVTIISFSWPTGKVHGSLARAGKVKGQTPKVWQSLFNRSPFIFLLVYTAWMLFVLKLSGQWRPCWASNLKVQNAFLCCLNLLILRVVSESLFFVSTISVILPFVITQCYVISLIAVTLENSTLNAWISLLAGPDNLISFSSSPEFFHLWLLAPFVVIFFLL